MSTAFWKTDWVIGILVVLVCFTFSQSRPLRAVDWLAYDMAASFSTSRPANQNVVVVAIDNEALKELGAWPWSRDILAEVTRRISLARPAVIGFALPFDKKQSSQGLEYITKLRELLDAKGRSSKEIKHLLTQAEHNLNADDVFLSALRNSGRIVFAIPYQLSSNQTQQQPHELNTYLKRYALHNVANIPESGNWFTNLFRRNPVPIADVIYPPIEDLTRYVGAVGHINLGIGNLDVFRHEPLIVQYGQDYIPSFSLMLAIRNNNKSVKNIAVDLDEGVTIDNKKVITDNRLQVYPRFYLSKSGETAFETISITKVYKDETKISDFKDKIVIIGLTTKQHTAHLQTPIGVSMPPVNIAAHTVSSLVSQDQYVIPQITRIIQLIAYVLVAFYLIFLLPRLRVSTGLVVSLLLLIGFINAHFIAMISSAVWVPLMVPAVALVIGHIVIGVKHYFEDSFGHVKAELSSANMALGQSFHAQGQLDQAFEKYRKCNITPDVLHSLYNLGLDYERKRQLSKAAAVFKYITLYDASYHDVQERLGRNKQVSDAMVFGGGPKTNNNMNGTLILDNTGIQKPMIGRYQIDEELGRGAMGMVYLGHDPKIGRTVAIKTMMLSQEFEDDKIEDVKRRFYREAETAGRLNHPNIVTIYDVGEDQDLSYIAMDYLKGSSLDEFCKPESLLSATEVFDIVAQVADALEYAQKQNVVHRDIKPANIMYDPATKTLKVTDFGVACLTDASKTKTGTILGSPSYMSPEQLAGKRVDGRSDLFSLGVTFYQLLTGELPFIGESMASLMYKITNEKHPDIRMFRPDLPACVSTVMNKALQKDLEKRFQTGERMASAIHRCRERIGKKKDS